MANLNITNIPAPRVPFIDERTGLMAREWYRFFLNLFVLTGSGNNPITLEELQIGPPNQPDLTELLIQINQNIAPQYEDQSGDFLATLDTAQLMSMMSRFENAEAAIQGAYLQPVVQTGTIANYNLDGSPTAGGIAYGTGPALAVSAAGTSGQVLTSAAAGTPTWTTPTTGTVTSVSVVSANGLAGTVATATTTPAITLSTTVTGVVKGNGTALSAAVAATDYVAPSAYASVNGLTMATARLLGRTTAATGAAEEISVAGGLTLSGGTLTGTSGTVTSVSFTGGIITVATATTTPALTVAGTSGGIPYFSSASTWASSAALAAGSLVLGGGAGVTPATTTTGTGVVTALGVNTGTAGAFVVNGGALGTPSSGTVTNLTGTASININGTVGATTPTTGSFTTVATSNSITATRSVGGTFDGLTVTNANAAADQSVFARVAVSNAGATGYLTMMGTGYTPSIGVITANSLGVYSGDAAGVWIAATNAAGTVRIAAGGTTAVGTLTSTGLNSTAIGATTPSTGSFTTMKASTGAAVGGATPGAGGIAFPATQVSVSDVNTLDDYEEGTFTATITCGVSGTITLTSGAGGDLCFYTKIGRMVEVNGYLVVASVSSPAGAFNVNGLPFTVFNSNGNYAAVAVRGDGLNAAAVTSLQGYASRANTVMSFEKFSAGAAAVLAGNVQAASNFMFGCSYNAAT